MKIKEIHCKHWILSESIGAITLYPFIFYNTNTINYKENFKTLQKHEMVHVEQVKKIGFFKFYFTYLFGKKDEYEKEAYRKEHDVH